MQSFCRRLAFGAGVGWNLLRLRKIRAAYQPVATATGRASNAWRRNCASVASSRVWPSTALVAYEAGPGWADLSTTARFRQGLERAPMLSDSAARTRQR